MVYEIKGFLKIIECNPNSCSVAIASLGPMVKHVFKCLSCGGLRHSAILAWVENIKYGGFHVVSYDTLFSNFRKTRSVLFCFVFTYRVSSTWLGFGIL